MSLQCPWLVRCCPTRSSKERRDDRILPPLPTQGLQSTGLTGPAEVKAQMQKLTRVGALLCGWLMNVVSVQAWLLLPRAVFSGVNVATTKLNILLCSNVCLVRLD